MSNSNFEDPRKFVPGLLDFIDLSRPNKGVTVPEHVQSPLRGQLKSANDCSDFIVLEPVGEYPGMPDSMMSGRRKFLSAGPDTDMPGLCADNEMFVSYFGRRLPAVAFTVYKWGTGTWPVQDAVAQGLSQQLRRNFNPKDVLESGMKDRKGRTVQQFTVPGLSIREAKRIDWSRIQWNAQRSGFLVKDVRPTDKLLRMGSHGANFFDVRIKVAGKSREQLEEYMAPRAQWLDDHDYLVPNYFHRQRLGPGQNMQMHGLALLTGNYKPVHQCNPLMTNVEMFLHHLLFQPSARDGRQVEELRTRMASNWQYNFDAMERDLRRVHSRYNLSLEYEVAKRLANTDRFGGCCEAIVYDMRKRLSMCVGAWQAYYWNWELHNQMQSKRMQPTRTATIPLAMSCEDSKRTYRRTPLGQQCLSELALIERKATRADQYLEDCIGQHWDEFDAMVAQKRLKNADYRPDRELLPDDLGLSFDLVLKLFSGGRAPGRPDVESLSAALVKRLYLVPRDMNGYVKESAPRRKSYTRAEEFEYTCEDEGVRIRTWLRSGSYFTTLAGVLFDTADPEELEVETATAVAE